MFTYTCPYLKVQRPLFIAMYVKKIGPVFITKSVIHATTALTQIKGTPTYCETLGFMTSTTKTDH
jgi:hypothetical protein